MKNILFSKYSESLVLFIKDTQSKDDSMLINQSHLIRMPDLLSGLPGTGNIVFLSFSCLRFLKYGVKKSIEIFSF